MKLIIKEHGDSSVGIPERYYEVDCPFERNEVTEEDLLDFKTKIHDDYEDYSEGWIDALYDFEMQNDIPDDQYDYLKPEKP